MKTTLKTTIIALLLTVTYNFTKAAAPDVNEKLTMRYAIAAYVDAFAHGHFDGLPEVIDDSAKFTLNRGQKILSFSKTDIITSLKGQQNVEQNCKTTTRIVENTGNLVVYKVQMKYDNFSRINYVTMTDTGAGWKITNVSTVFN
jgi:hypothetical protein